MRHPTPVLGLFGAAAAAALVLLTTIVSIPAVAQTPSPPVADPALLVQIIEDVASGWENADGAPFERHYLDVEGARYVETGGQNVGLRDLVDHHVVPEGDSLSSLDLALTAVETHFEGSFAWAIADVALQATVAADGSKLERVGYETFLFRWVDGAWKVVHTHSSTRAPRPAAHD